MIINVTDHSLTLRKRVLQLLKYNLFLFLRVELHWYTSSKFKHSNPSAPDNLRGNIIYCLSDG